MEDNMSYVQILVNTLQKQVETLQDILELTREQNKIAENTSFDEQLLDYTLNRKEVLIARLNELDDGFVSVYERVRKEVVGQQERYKDQLLCLQDLIKQCTDLSVEIKVMEEWNRTKLVQCFAKKHKEYGTQQTAASVASRYHQTMHNMQVVDSFFFNKKN